MQALCSGVDQRVSNPLFYVSGSEWNLFDLLVNFFHYYEIPQGSLFLRDTGIRFDKGDTATGMQEFKHSHICYIRDTFAHLKFILIGVNGQHGPNIYKQIAEQYPGHIRGFYIRDVSEESRDSEVHRIAEEVRKKGTEMLLLSDSVSAARHALQMKWINEEQLARIEEDCKQDDEGETFT